MTKFAFTDVETNGLDPEVHRPWEVALILRDDAEERGSNTYEQAFTWQLPVDLTRAEPAALRISRFHDRYTNGGEPDATDWRNVEIIEEFAAHFAKLTIGAHLVGANPAFDERMLHGTLRRGRQCPMWHHRMYDVESMVAAHLRQPIRGLKDSAVAVSVDPGGYALHTAMGDATLTRDVFDAVMGGE